MFKFLFYFNILILIAQYEGTSFKRGRLNDNSLKDETPWQNLWFPHPPNYQNDIKPETVNVAAAAGKTSEEDSSETRNSTVWPGLWFPHPPGYQNEVKVKENIVKPKENVNKKHDCDNGKVINKCLHILVCIYNIHCIFIITISHFLDKAFYFKAYSFINFHLNFFKDVINYIF